MGDFQERKSEREITVDIGRGNSERKEKWGS
jgi:hypothetical protein